MYVMCCPVYVRISMSSCLQRTDKASYVIKNHSHSLSLPSLSFTLIPVIHTLSVSLSVVLFLSLAPLSFLLAKFHTTCPRQSRFTDYHPLDAKIITCTHVDGKPRSDTHAQTPTHTPRHAVPRWLSLGELILQGFPCLSVY